MFGNCPNSDKVEFSMEWDTRHSQGSMERLAFLDCQIEPIGGNDLGCQDVDQFMGTCKALKAAEKALTHLTAIDLNLMVFKQPQRRA